MENKINIAELLRNCPKGMELDCTMYDNCTYAGIEDVGYIDILINTPSGRIRLTKEGCYIRHDDNAKCVIFPKGKNTWEGFVSPCKFKDGDIVATTEGFWIGITEGGKKECFIPTYCVIKSNGEFETYFDKKEKWCFDRLATVEEKQKLFDAIKANGYRWNAETKTLEKLVEPRFKVGDRIRHKTHIRQGNAVTEIKDTHYILDDELALPFISQDEYELVPNKFDITTLKPFDKVLGRDKNTDKWLANFWGFYDTDNAMNYPYECCGNSFAQCIPYEGNQHLLGTTNDCDDFYKTWKK